MQIVGKIEESDHISSKSYFGTMLLGVLPIIGDVLLIKWSKDASVRRNKQSLCVAFLMIKLVILYPTWIILLTLILIS